MQNDFTWLVHLRDEINTEDYFSFSDVTADDLQELPPAVKKHRDYVKFLSEFGTANLCRDPGNFWYSIRILKPEIKGDLIRIGFALEVESLFVDRSGNLLVGTWRSNKPYTRSFSEWLRDAFDQTTKSIVGVAWEGILHGPPPFTEREKEMVAALDLFKIEKIGTTPDGKLRVRVRNESPTTLSRLTVRVTAGNVLEGAVGLDVKHVKPGEPV